VIAAVIFGGWALKAIWGAQVRRALWLGVVAAPLVFGPVFAWLLPGASTVWPSKAAGEIVARAKTSPKTTVYSTGYREPSLVFNLGTDGRFVEPAQLVAELRGKRTWLALVAADALADFRERAWAAGVGFRPIGVVRGFNYSRGRWERLTLFGPPVDGKSAN